MNEHEKKTHNSSLALPLTLVVSDLVGSLCWYWHPDIVGDRPGKRVVHSDGEGGGSLSDGAAGYVEQRTELGRHAPCLHHCLRLLKLAVRVTEILLQLPVVFDVKTTSNKPKIKKKILPERYYSKGVQCVRRACVSSDVRLHFVYLLSLLVLCFFIMFMYVYSSLCLCRPLCCSRHGVLS